MTIGDQTSTVTSVDRLGPEQLQKRCRSINEQIWSLSASAGFNGDLDLVCECAKPGCFEIVRASRSDFDQVRRFPTRFLIKAGHIDYDTERVVEETSRFVVVEKFGPEAEIAVRNDPRRHGSPRPVPEPSPAA